MLAQMGILSKTTHIGLDVGATGVRAVQLRYFDGAWRVSCIAQRAFSTTQATGVNLDSDRVTELTRQCVRSESFRGRQVAMALPPDEMKFHALELPHATLLQDVDTANDMARVEISRLMTAAPNEIEADHWMLPSTSSGGPNAIGLGVRSQVVMEALSMCQHAGLSCICADASALALQRLGCALKRWDSKQLWGMLDLGHTGSRLVLSVGTTPVLVRQVGSGGYAWTKKIAETLQIGDRAAEIHKREHGIALTGRGVRSADGAPPLSELAGIVFGALRGVLGDLAGEIKRSYEYILSHYGIEEAGDLVLVGGGAGMPHLASYLGQSLGISAQGASAYDDAPPCAIRMAPEHHAPWERLALGMGLALHGKESTGEH